MHQTEANNGSTARAGRIQYYHWKLSRALILVALSSTCASIEVAASNGYDAAVCTFDIDGRVGTTDGSSKGYVNCTGDKLVQLHISQSSTMPLNLSFHGVAIAKDPALPAASALLTFSNVTLTIVNSSLQHIATDLDAVLGLYNSTVSFINSTFTNNTAKTSGGLLAQKMMGVSIANCVFENSTGSLAGAVYVEESNSVVINSSLFWNNGGSRAGAIYLEDSDITTVDDSRFSNNAARRGGGLTINVTKEGCAHSDGCSCNLTSSIFSGNQATEFGGGVYIAATQVNLAVDSCAFVNNTVQGTAAGHIDSSGQGLGGGGLYLNKTAGKSTNLVSIILFNSSLQANSAYGSGAHDDGGGMYVDAADVVRVVHSEFRDNSGRLGGAAFVRGGNTSIAGAVFSHNSGGALACQDNSAVKLVATHMDNNDATGGSGGALKVFGRAAGHVVLDDVHMTGNKADSGGAISVESIDEYGKTFMSINSSSFTANTASRNASGATFATLSGSGGALRLFVAVLWVDGTSFQSNYASNVGGAIFFLQSCIPDTELQHYAFNLPSAKTDATERHDCSSFVISDSDMGFNTARAGGGIYTNSTQGFHVFCGGGLNQVEQIAQVSNTNQAADVAVPCQSWQDGQNSAPSGPVIAYPAAGLVVSCNRTTQQSQLGDLPVCSDAYTDSKPSRGYAAQLDNFWSTSALQGSDQDQVSSIFLGVQLQDALNQSILLDFPSAEYPIVHLEAVGDGGLFGPLEETVQSVDNTARFAETYITAAPGPMKIDVSCSNQPGIPKSRIIVNVRRCLTGEVQGSRGDVCDRCPPEDFSFETTNATCDKPCPAHAQCPGRANMYPDYGYWHSNASAAIVHKCPNPDACHITYCRGSRSTLETCQSAWYNASNKPEAQAILNCSLWEAPFNVGAASYCDEQCTPGYRGFLCAVCSQGYGVSGRFECEHCPAYHTALLKYCLLILAIVAINAILIWELGTASSTGSSWNEPEGADYVDALLAYVQLVSMLVILDIEWPPALDPVFKFASAMVQLTPQLVSLDCILRHHQSSLPLAVSRALVQICLPFAILAFFCAVWLILFPLLRWRWPSGKYSAAWLVRQLQVTSYSVLGYFYPSITQAALSIFSCYPIDVSVPSTTPYPSFLKATWDYGYWISDMDTECFKGWHKTVTLGLALPSLLCFTLGIPALITSLVGKWRQMLHTPRCKEKIGYMYRAYRQGRWWEQSAFQLKLFVLLIVVINGRPQGNFVQMLVLLCLLILEFAYQVYQHPYRFAHVQLVREVLMLLLSFSVIAGLFFENYQQQASREGLALVAIGVAVVNMAFVVYMLYYICHLYLKELIRVLTALYQHVRRSTREKVDSVLQLTSMELPGFRQAQH